MSKKLPRKVKKVKMATLIRQLRNGELFGHSIELADSEPSETVKPRTSGVLPSQGIRELINESRIFSKDDIPEEQIQPASLDLRLGNVAYRVQASFLPGRKSTVREKVKQLEICELDLTTRTVLEKGCVYIVPLLEEMRLPDNIAGKANPKSTTGRLDIFTRVITDFGVAFEEVAQGYKGKLYAEIVPRTFTVAVRTGMRLNQLRFFKGNPISPDSVLEVVADRDKLVFLDPEVAIKADISRGLRFTLNLPPGAGSEVVAYRAKKTTPVIDLDQIDHYEPEEFWDIKRSETKGRLVIDPGDFYILASRERVRVPPDYAAEMLAIDPSMGEFRTHYAGFFDPGFGYGANSISGTQAVLEVRAHEVPFVLEHEQIVGRLMYMHLLERPDKIYGTGIGSSYQHQALTLSKHFKRS